LSNLIKSVDQDDTGGRYITAALHGIGTRALYITSVYFPCMKSSNDYIVESSSVVAYVDNTLRKYSDSDHLIAGDFNFEYKPGTIGFDIFSDIVLEYKLICCDNFNVNINVGYTYFHETLNHKSWLDHFFITSGLSQSISGFEIIDSGANLSDHMPIGCTFTLPKSININTVKVRPHYTQRWNKADLNLFYSESYSHLQSIVVPTNVLKCETGCCCVGHNVLINEYYNNIVYALRCASSRSVPNIPFNSLKAFWNDELDRLKSISIDMHKLWRQIGSPHSGLINAERIKAKLAYKSAIKLNEFNYERQYADELNNKLLNKDSKNFWKCWNSRSRKKPSCALNVAGQSDPKCIANEFRTFYANTYVNSRLDSAAVNEFQELINSPNMTNVEALPDNYVSTECIERCIGQLKLGKAAGLDKIVAEHIVYSHPCLVIHIKLLFSMMVNHYYVPDAFGSGIVVPVVKDKSGDLSSLDNYRPITLSPVMSKLFESFILAKYSDCMKSDDLQFGFKKNLGCNNAIFALRQSIEYFNARGSNVYMASLDASKAFDRVNHFKLFSTLIKKGLPKIVVKIIVNWYSKLFVVIRWNDYDSTPLTVLSGVRQGGILSPILFNMYVDCIITALRKSDYGCHLRYLYVGCFLYADDLILLSASIYDLQKMLNICGKTGIELGLNFNAMKSKCIVIGPTAIGSPATMIINNLPLQWVDKVKYLGICICSGKSFCTDFAESRRKFFASVNTMFSNLKYASDIVKLQLIESYCLPLLTYALECLNTKSAVLHEINSWWNSIFRRIFGYSKWESVKEVICRLGRLDLLHIINMRRLLFLKHLSQSNNKVVRDLATFLKDGTEFHTTQAEYNVQLSWSAAKIKAMSYVSFKSICGVT
jgi:hypothetical protein